MIEISIRAGDTIKGLARFRRNIKKDVAETLEQQGRSTKRFLKSPGIAPRDSGTLRSGIGFTATKTKLKVFSVVPGSFKYNKWVNQDPGFVSLGPYKKSNTKYGIKQGQTLIYGSSPTHWNWSGTPGYMTHGWYRLRKNFPLALRRRLRKSLKR